MGDRAKLKHVCPECKTNKWIIDYKEGCAADLTTQSICLFCQQAKEIEKLKKRKYRTEEQDRGYLLPDNRTE